MTDHELIEQLLDAKYEDRISGKERRAFESMLDQRHLTDKQRSWVYGVADRFGIRTASAKNLFSAMPADKQRENLSQVRTLFPWEQPGYAKAIKPPGK